MEFLQKSIRDDKHEKRKYDVLRTGKGVVHKIMGAKNRRVILISSCLQVGF